MERREQGMRAEYKMAVDAQQASKDKWYQRYNDLPLIIKINLNTAVPPHFPAKEWLQIMHNVHLSQKKLILIFLLNKKVHQ